ncbi:hypothetical protein SAMN05444397_105289 [Flavobacterium aquidurense]|uniref:SMI1 / KNR4 family (SUKH-1) n=1 Tax=Flavobacterium frigidimaris TaxID=262320 RepID=A0ABX4BVM6_FLAFR|nr:hypothetical protein [Flavobacterium frigidimaris]OXA81868.1 hypothetical protein B0A65_02215 [Flavobacterium frigidimaris]SDZ34296.1 hypothetical protein SAMN05444397_105289 [Flavobacterium aquidurense]
MTFYDRYLNGETKKVYDDIYKLGEDAFLPDNIVDIEKVMTETFERVSYNLDVIYKELLDINYLFKTNFQFNFERPLIKPFSNTDSLLQQLDESIKPFGFVPISLKMFYKIVGACNFGWDYETNENFIWECADPIQIISLDELVTMATNEYALEDFEQYFEDEGFVSLDLSADYLHKDNISGGQSYSIQITSKPSIDAKFLNEEHNTTFINYLRICFDNCGFSRITNAEHNNIYQSFFNKVKPKLKEI